jgi:hypothetical protein
MQTRDPDYTGNQQGRQPGQDSLCARHYAGAGAGVLDGTTMNGAGCKCVSAYSMR